MGIVAARTSHGKTALMVSIAYNMAQAGLAPVIFSLEQPAKMIIGRLVSVYMQAPLDVAASTTLEGTQRDLRAEALEWVRTSRISAVEGRNTVDSICATSPPPQVKGRM